MVAHAPSVVLLDEPSSGSPSERWRPWGSCWTTCRHRLGATLVIVEHDIAFVAGLADRLVALDRGRVLAEGEPGRGPGPGRRGGARSWATIGRSGPLRCGEPARPGSDRR